MNDIQCFGVIYDPTTYHVQLFILSKLQFLGAILELPKIQTSFTSVPLIVTSQNIGIPKKSLF